MVADYGREYKIKDLESRIEKATSACERHDLEDELDALNTQIKDIEDKRKKAQRDEETYETIQQVGHLAFKTATFPFVLVYRILLPILMLIMAVTGFTLVTGMFLGSVWYLAATGGADLIAIIIILAILL